jgi:hypothetical protein
MTFLPLASRAPSSPPGLLSKVERVGRWDLSPRSRTTCYERRTDPLPSTYPEIPRRPGARPRPGRHATRTSKTKARSGRAMIVMPFVTCLDATPMPLTNRPTRRPQLCNACHDPGAPTARHTPARGNAPGQTMVHGDISKEHRAAGPMASWPMRNPKPPRLRASAGDSASCTWKFSPTRSHGISGRMKRLKMNIPPRRRDAEP